jgi:radical SAM superfamily enzyme YgiQ (UPF0313 family)
MTPTKILFVNAINTYVESQTRYPPLGIGYLVAMLRREFGSEVDCRLIEAGVEGAIRDWQPHLVGIGAVSQNFNLAMHYAELAREAGSVVVAGGYHITEMPTSMTPAMDVGVLGEGEHTMCELVATLRECGSLPPDRLSRIAGIAYRDGGGELEITEPRPVVGAKTKSLDELPMPARDLMQIRPHTNMVTSRGCPYNCTFCASTRFWPNIRYFSPEYMIEEVKQLIRDHGVRYITFHDDLFIANVQRLREFHDLVLKEDLPRKGFRFSCSSSATRITEEMATLLKEMNFVTVSMGLESGNQEVLRRLKGPAFKVETNQRAVEILHRHGIHVHATFIIGEPRETLKQMQETYDFVRRNPFALVSFFALTPLPGTRVWHDAKARGLVSDTMDWSRLSEHFEFDWRKSIIVSEVVSRRDIRRMYLKMRRLRLYKMARAMLRHPFQMDLGAYLKAKAAEWAFRLGLRRRPETIFVDSAPKGA